MVLWVSTLLFLFVQQGFDFYYVFYFFLPIPDPFLLPPLQEVYPLCTPACAQLLQGDASLAGCRRSEEEAGPSTTPSSMMW